MFGQVRIEFIFGMVIFGLVIFFIVSGTNLVLSRILWESRSNSLKAKAISVLTIMVEDEGEPVNWQILPDSSVKRVGLANQPYNLSREKVNRLSSPNNCTLLNNFDLRAYRLKIYNSTNLILFCGFDSLEPVTAIVKKSIFIDNSFGNISLEMW